MLVALVLADHIGDESPFTFSNVRALETAPITRFVWGTVVLTQIRVFIGLPRFSSNVLLQRPTHIPRFEYIHLFAVL